MTILHKYAAGILNVLGVFITALVATLDRPLNAAAVVQLGIILIGAVGTFLVPLSAKKWQGIWKTGTAILAAILSAVLPFAVQGHLSAQNLLVVVLAGLTALGTEVGVSIRSASLAAPDEPLPAILGTVSQVSSDTVAASTVTASTVTNDVAPAPTS